jgi:nucleoside-diphosphate-sugar epimerase
MFTVVGADGFIGRHLVRHLESVGEPVLAFSGRLLSEGLAEPLRGALGHLIYCVGLTADFRERPFDTIEAHVSAFAAVLRRARYESVTYLSSTRVYGRGRATDEDAMLSVQPSDPSDLYNLSKLAGESLCLASGQTSHVVRLSNVYGRDFGSSNFMSAVLRQAAEEGKVLMRSSPASAKDFVSIDDVTAWVPAIAARGSRRIYNLACGRNISNATLASALRELGIEVEFGLEAPDVTFPPISTTRVTEEFFPPKKELLADLPELLSAFGAAATTKRGATRAPTLNTDAKQ